MAGLMDVLRGILSEQQQPPAGALSGFLMPPAQPNNDIANQAFAMFPALRRYGLSFINSSGQPSKYGGGSETYHADESESPLRGRATIEQFDPNLKPLDFLGEALHIAPSVDPVVNSMRNEFLGSMTPQQHQRMREQYSYEQKNYGENRPFDRWRDISGNDSWFRGHVTGQWPASMYTPEQLRIFESLMQHLRNP